MLDSVSVLLIIIVMGGVTFLTRALPFALFRNKEKPRFVAYLCSVLPVAIITVLVVYCLQGIRLFSYPYGLPELISAAAVAVLHLWKRNVLISIFSGTALYMLLIQVIF